MTRHQPEKPSSDAPAGHSGRDLVIEAIIQAAGLGWRTISLSRLRRLADGDAAALPLGRPETHTTTTEETTR